MKKTLAAILILVMMICLSGCGAEKIIWADLVLGDMLPEAPANKGEIHENSAEQLWIYIDNLSDKQFADYVTACKEKGFTVDAKSDSSSYDAYNADGYKLSLGHYGSDAEMSVDLEAPMEMTAITWPTSIAGKQLPTPKSKTGKFSYEYDDNFFIYVGNTSRADYAEYVNACSQKGFNVDYSKGDDFYYADNAEGWHIDIRYVGYNIMSINIDAPSEDDSSNETSTSSTEEFSPDVTEKETETDSPNNSDIDSDFKEAMDSYEKFMDEYVAFMKKYKADPTDMGLLSDYADYMSKYADFVEDFEKWEDEELTTAEAAYYVDVQSRVSKKLLEVAN